MTRRILASALLLSLASFPALASAARRSAQPEAFDRILIEGAYEVEVQVTPGAPSLTFHASERVLDHVTWRVTDGELVLDLESDHHLVFHDGVRVEVRVPALVGLRIDGAGEVRVEGLTGIGFRLDNDGAGEVVLAGSVDRLELDVDGAGEVDAFELKARDVVARIDGVGNLQVCATDTADFRVNGVGAIVYDCEPAQVTERVDGLGSIGPR